MNQINFIFQNEKDGKKFGAKFATPIKDKEQYFALRNTEANKQNFMTARYGEDAVKAAEAKKELTQFTYNSMLPEGKLKGACYPTGLFAHDIDIATDAEIARHEYDEVKRRGDIIIKKVLDHKDEIGLRELSRTPHFGLHLICNREMGKTILENQVRIATILREEMDTNNKDFSRVMFTGPTETEDGKELIYLDETLFECPLTMEQSEAEYQVLKDRQTNDLEEIPAEAKKSNKHFKPWIYAEGYVEPESETTESHEDATAESRKEKTIAEDHKEEATSDTSNNIKEVLPKKEEVLSYNGIPYAEIISKYWELHYDGHEPVKNNRDTLTYELANQMKHICGFDRQLLDKVIPCYDGFPEEQKMKCIDSALSGKRTQMPKNLKEVLASLRRNKLITSKKEDALATDAAFEAAMNEDDLFYYNRIPKKAMVQGIKDSIDAAGHTLAMPVLTAICPFIGARATGVKLDVHGKENTLNLISYIVGDFGSGKGQMDDIVQAWMSEDIAMAKIYNQQWSEWRDNYRISKNKKELPAEPKLPKVWITLNNTIANLAELLSRVEGRHAASFTPEADVVADQWDKGISNFSTMIRLSYDGSSYDREARSADAVNVHIERLLWNVCMCGTPDALYRVVPNCTDGLLSRIGIARTPDNTFSPLPENPAHLTDSQKERIQQVSHLLPLLNGSIKIDALEKQGRRWLEDVRLETMKNDDRVMARLRIRTCITAQRMICCLMLVAMLAKMIKEHGVNGAEKLLRQDPTLWQKNLSKLKKDPFLELYDVIADSLLDNTMYFFGTRIEDAMKSSNYTSDGATNSGSRTRKGKNDSVFAHLAVEFSFVDAMNNSIAVKGSGVTQNSVRQMLKNWQGQKLIEPLDNGNYRKCA